jgi:LemA protein
MKMIKTIMILFISIILFIILIKLIKWIIKIYNSFIYWKQVIKLNWSNLLAEYQRRADLFFNLSQTVKTYYNFEEKALTSIILARNGNFGKTKDEQIKNIKELDDNTSKLLMKLFALVEQYPNLKSISQFNRLSKEISLTENRINMKRIQYNSSIKSYNLIVNTIPTIIIAKIFSFKEEDYYTNENYEYKFEI